MEHLNQRFLEAVKAALCNQTVDWKDELSSNEWIRLFQLAQIHNVLPLVYEAVYSCPAAQNLDPTVLQPFKRQAIQAAALQTSKTHDFLQLNQALQTAGATPLVVKGLVCRTLYPQPDLRPSSDEDILIPSDQFSICCAVMASQEMCPLNPNQDRDRAYEVSYRKKNSPFQIEVHKSLFPKDSDAYGELNRFFDGVFDRAVAETIQGVSIQTMGYTDHLFYLICHAFKHFLHSGFGIRQVCDIILFANTYGKQVDWFAILDQCRDIHAELFAAALFRIGVNYLNFAPERACYPEEWRAMRVDETAMLEDLLSGGIYGAADMSRKHSSNITLNAVTANKEAKRGNPVLKTVFPSAKKLEPRYPYLKKYPYLLPAAWIDRLFKYGKELKAVSNNHAANAIQIGNQRIALLKQYGIIR